MSMRGDALLNAIGVEKADLERLPRRVFDRWTKPTATFRGAGKPGPVQVVDLFSGCGGMSAGFAMVNHVLPAFELLLAGDIDRWANRSFRSNLGVVPCDLDVSAVVREPGVFDRLLNDAGRDCTRPLILIGCAPCQGFSSHRNSAGHLDPRNNLVIDFVDLAIEIAPDVIVSENVPEMLSDSYWPIVSEAVLRLERAGYWVHLSVHNLAEHGVPQERFRTLLLASRHPIGPPDGRLARGQFRTVRDAIAHLPVIEPGVADPEDALHYTARHRPSTVETIMRVPQDGGNRPMDVGPESLRRAAKRQGKPAFEDVYGRLAWDRPAVTITAHARNPASGRYSHPEQHRGLSVREAALLQGFPKGWTFEGSLGEQFRQIGNAVPPLFASGLAASLLVQLIIPPDADEIAPTIRESVGSSFSRLIPGLKARRELVGA